METNERYCRLFATRGQFLDEASKSCMASLEAIVELPSVT